MASASFPSPRTQWAARLGLIAYAALLSASLLASAGRAGVAGAGLLDLRTGARIHTVALALAVYAVVEVLRFVPVEIFAVLSAPRALGDRAQKLLLAAAAGAGKPGHRGPRAHARGRLAMAGPSDLVLPAIGCAIGVGACLGWWGGWNAWRRVLITFVVALFTVPVVAGIALFAVSEREPVVRESPAVTSPEKCRLYALLRHKNPKRLAPGELRNTLTLANRDLDLLLAWGLPVVLGDGRAAAHIDLESPHCRCHSDCPAVSAI